MRTISVVVSLCSLLAAGTAAAQDALVDLSAQTARVDRAKPHGRLAPGRPLRVETLRAFLRARHDDATLRDLVQVKEHESGGVEHVTFGQQVAGLDVYGTYAKASFRDGDLTSVVENLVSTAHALRPARVGPDEALRVVLERFYPGIGASPREVSSLGNVITYAPIGSLDHEPTVTRIALPLRGRALDTGYLVATWDRANQLRNTVVSGRGVILREQLRTNREGYRIFPNHPGVTSQQLVMDPADPFASPLGWLGASTTTIGNNVNAYLDRDNNDAADVNGRPVAANQIFDFAWDGAADPTTAMNQKVAVTNLFYLTNRVHDRLYNLGFTESAGNFQMNNFGKGGLENDPLDAEAQDGGGTDNANFATPDDGSRPRMQMYLWDQSTPWRDGDLDSDIVYHEYGHGLTWRMIGDMSGVVGEATGEGMSDALAIYFNGDDRLAEYSYNNPVGIRSAPYTNYTRTYGLVVGVLGPHLDGEIYAATLWRLRELWLAKGWSQQTLLRYIVDGMNYTPPIPAYEDMRDGILMSMSNLSTEIDGGQAACTVWDAFAQFGIGVGADGYETCIFPGFCFFQATESFTKPDTCNGPPPPTNTAPTVVISSPADGSSVTAGKSVSFAGTANDTQDGVLTNNLVWTSSLQGQIGVGAGFSRTDLVVGTHVITASVTDSGNLTGSATVTIVVNPNTPPTVTISAPANNTSVKLGTSVTFTGSATDTQDGNLTAGLIWTSNRQGQIGTGATFSRADLVAGAHVITARATDSGQLTGSAQVNVTVVNITLSARGYKVKNARKVDLTWSGATTANVTIYRNNASLITTANDGLHTDSVSKAGTYSYRVCNAGSTTLCSNTVSVTF